METGTGGPGARRATLAAAYGLLLAGELVWASAVPLLPRIADDLGLSASRSGLALGATSVAFVLVCLPVGALADRVSPRRVTAAAGALVAVSAVGHALAGGFPSLLAARLAFGVGFAGVWTAGVVVIADAAPPARRAQALSATMTMAGAAAVVGPGLAGVLAARIDPRVPFVGAGVVAAVLAAVLARLPDGAAVPGAAGGVLAALRAAPRAPALLLGLALMGVAGLVANATNLLGPATLHDLGWDEAGIGLVLSAGGALYVGGSAATSVAGSRAVGFGVAAALVGALTVACLVPLHGSAAAVAGFLVLRGAILGPIYALSWPLCVGGAEGVGVGRGAAVGLANVVWSGAAAIGPIAAGAALDVAGAGPAYIALAAASAVVLAYALRARGRGEPALS